MLDGFRKAISAGYGFLGDSSLAKLQDQVERLADIRSDLKGIETLEDEARSIGRMTLPFETELARSIKPLEIYLPPRPEETPIGRAAIESARNSREVAVQMSAVADIVAGLNQTLVTEVLPAWFKQVEADQRRAEAALRQAAHNLMWTKWAVVASVVATVAATGWQISVTRGIDRENTAQQKQAETLLREQLAAQQKLIEQQARDAEELRQHLRPQARGAEESRKLAGGGQNPAAKK